MIIEFLESFSRLLLSVETILIAVMYLALCRIFIRRLGSMLFATLLQCFWALSFSLLCRYVYCPGTVAYSAIIGSWRTIVLVLLILSPIPAWCVVHFTTGLQRLSSPALPRPIYPAFLGLVDVVWFSGILQIILRRDTGLEFIPPFRVLIPLTVLAITLTGLLGTLLTRASCAIFHERAMTDGIAFYRLAGMLTVYVPICLYGAWLGVAFDGK